jgi:hypothetical protein
MFVSRTGSTREKFLMTLLPAALILAAYAFFVAIPKQKNYRLQKNKISKARASAVSIEAADQSRARLQQVTNASRKLDRRNAAALAKIKTLCSRWKNRDSQISAVQDITALMEQFNLSISSQGYQADPKLTEYLQQLTRKIDQQLDAMPLEFWQVELQGTYMDVTNFLTAIEAQQSKTFAVSLSMKASESKNGRHSWTILFVI